MVSERQTTDTVPRITARDLFLILRTFEQVSESTMENVRLRLCHDRRMKRRGTFLWSTARDILGELDRLGYVSDVPSPKTARQFEEMAVAPVHITEEGKSLLSKFEEDKGDAYDTLFKRMYERHPYLQSLALLLQRERLFAPIISSMKEHVSDRYTSTSLLAEDVANHAFDIENFLGRLSGRIQRQPGEEETREIREGVAALVREAALSAAQEELASFAKNFMEKLNHIVIPALFRKSGIAFDYRTHRTLWSLGEEFRLWCITRSHPDYDGLLVYSTARIQFTQDNLAIANFNFDSGLAALREDFMRRLYESYQMLQAKRDVTFVPAWELRSVFCVENRCQRSTFDRVFAEHYLGNGEYKLHLEIQRTKPQHEPILRAGDRNIGSIRVFKH
jgi:hypothetical protein